MKKLNFIVLMACAALFLASCNGSSSDDDTSEGNWVLAPELPGAGRFYAVSFTIGDTVAYVGSGNDGNKSHAALADFWRFDGGWTSVASIPVGRQQAVAFSIGGKGYVGTGTGTSGDANSGVYLKDFYAYDAASNTWSSAGQIPDLPEAAAGRARATAFSVNNKGYVVAGAQVQSSIYYLDMYSYDPTTNSWTQEDGLPNDKRYGASSFVYDGKGYVVGGMNSSGELSPYFFRFDPATSKWDKPLRQIYNQSDSSYDDDWSDIERLDAVTLVIGSKVYYMSGAKAENGSPSTTAWAYDPANDTWDQRASYSADRSTGARWGAVGFTINGNGYIGTGWNGGTPAYSNFDQYMPNQDLNTNN